MQSHTLWVLSVVLLAVTAAEQTSGSLQEVRLTSSVIINVPIQQVWPVQSDFPNMALWYKQFREVRITTVGPNGPNSVGTKRECVSTTPGKFVREELVAFNAAEYTYSYHMEPYTNEAENPLPFQTLNHRSDVQLYPVDGRSTFVKWSIRFDTDSSKAALATKVNEAVFGALFSQLAQYFNSSATARHQTDNFIVSMQTAGHGATSAATVRIVQAFSFADASVDKLYSIVQPADGNSPLWTVADPTPKLLKVLPHIRSTRTYHFADAGAAGYGCQLVERQVNSDAKAHTAMAEMDFENFNDRVLRSITNHKTERAVYPVVFNVPKDHPKSVFVVVDTFELDCAAHIDHAVAYFKWFNRGIVQFVQRTLSIPDETEFGVRNRRVQTSTFLTHSDLFWSAFDDYEAIQLVFSGHDQMTVNLTEMTVTFTQPGFNEPTIEQLTLKENRPPVRVWDIKFPKPNPLFSEWRATVVVSDSSDRNGRAATHVSLEMQFVLRSTDRKVRERFVSMLTYFIGVRLQQIGAAVAKWNGVKHAYEPFELNYPADKFYGLLSNWCNIDWVQFALGARCDRLNSLRWVYWPRGNSALSTPTMYETMPDVNKEKKTLTYFMQNAENMECQLYAADIAVTDLPGGRSRVQYISYILPLPDKTKQVVVDRVVGILTGRFKWLQETFTSSYKDEL